MSQTIRVNPPHPYAPLESIYKEIECAVETGLYYLAIAVTSSLPDVCVTLEGCERTTRETYKQWFRSNAAIHFTHFGENECWQLRCGILHNASFQGSREPKSRYNRVIFTPPDRSGITDEMVVNDYDANRELECSTLSLDVSRFCQKMTTAVKSWETLKASDATVQSNLEKIVRHRPQGFPGIYIGQPVIA